MKCCWGISKATSAAILENVEFNDQMQVMDFGAGTGLITSQVATHVDTVTAVDIQFVTAHTVNKEMKSYPIFLVTATKS